MTIEDIIDRRTRQRHGVRSVRASQRTKSLRGRAKVVTKSPRIWQPDKGDRILPVRDLGRE